ncbi:LPS assembly lipoprotein LptE [Devosia albogilva]|uniref:LPS assembly lipoprotein LptE n=1 Tax=Devosia albogilva TaxID=429726 RepID=A0ABW5QJG5_9HYPH
MWWSSGFRSLAFATALVAVAVPLAGCSFSPVYGGAGALAGQQTLALNYAEPSGRLEQIIYQELRLRLGSSEAPDAPKARVTVVSVATDPTLAETNTILMNDARRVMVTANLTITRPGEARPLTITRVATADYVSTNQVLAANAAADEAAERAAKAVAESLRLALLADLSR